VGSLIELGFAVALLVVTYFIGSRIERKHFESIRAREKGLLDFVTVTFRHVPEGWQVEDSRMVTGCVVVSLDHFKRFLAGLKTIVGGRITAYEPLLDRGRREALLRMQEAARADGYDAVINVRYETSTMASAGGDRRATAGIEILAYGTALKLASDPAAV